MILIDSDKKLDIHLSEMGGEILLLPIFSSLMKHSKESKISLLIISDGVNDYIINYNNIDSDTVSKKIDFSIFDRVWVIDLKSLLYAYPYTPNMYDLQLSLFHRDKNYDVDELSIYTEFRRRGAPKANDLIPIFKHYEQFGLWKGLWKQCDSVTEFSQLYPTSLHYIEKNGISTVDNGLEYTHYNYFTITSRPSNTFNGINYAALNKSDGTRYRFNSRFSNGLLYSFDYDGYHLRLISKLIGVNIPKNERAHNWLSYQYGVTDEDTSKGITFRQIYGGVQREFEHIPFLKSVKEYVDSLWEEYLLNGCVYTPLFKRKIGLTNGINKNKLFNYVLQSFETERNIFIIGMLSKLDLDGVLPVLYTYDSILFDSDKNTDISVLKKIKSVLEYGGFPMKIEVGNNYNEMMVIDI